MGKMEENRSKKYFQVSSHPQVPMVGLRLGARGKHLNFGGHSSTQNRVKDFGGLFILADTFAQGHTLAFSREGSHTLSRTVQDRTYHHV